MIIEYKHAEMPADDDTVWRYMGLDKFADLLRRRKMYFRRIDLLDDQFEGAYTNLHIPPQRRYSTFPSTSGASFSATGTCRSLWRRTTASAAM
jgi:hypothetical protein